MKLLLANNQSEKFKVFHKELQGEQPIYDYSGYDSIGFYFEKGVTKLFNTATGRTTSDYEAVYINGYLSTPEIATTVAIVLDHNNIHYVDRELSGALSLSKLSAYAKLAAANVTIPRTFAGAARALSNMIEQGIVDLSGKFVLKRADADRGIDNFLFENFEEALGLLETQEPRSMWILQEFIPNDGFYRVSFYHDQVAFGIFRTLEKRTDGRKDRAHMFKPRGGRNASWFEPGELPDPLIAESKRAVKAMNRQFAGVDVLYDAATKTACVLEVNYNPQLVTVETFKEPRLEAFLKAMREL